MTDDQRKHLEFLQAIVARMAQNSLTLKGWVLSVVSALFALSAHQSNGSFAVFALYPTFVFWLLDSYYLALERGFRQQFDAVASGQPQTAPYTIVVPISVKAVVGAAFAHVTWPVYASVLLMAAAILWAKNAGHL